MPRWGSRGFSRKQNGLRPKRPFFVFCWSSFGDHCGRVVVFSFLFYTAKNLTHTTRSGVAVAGPSGTTPSRSLDQRVNQDSLNTLYILIANGIDDAYPKINALAELTRFADDAAPPPRPWHRVRQLHWAHHRLLTRLHTNLKRPLRPSSCRPPS